MKPDETPRSMKRKPFLGMRKVFHVVSSSAVPVFYWFLPGMDTATQGRAMTLIVLGVVTPIAFLIDGLRLLNPRFNQYIMTRFSLLIRHTEQRRFTGATFVCLSFLLVVWFFPREIAVAAMLFLSLGDTAAEIAGKNWGRRRYWGRSLEGMAGFFVAALPVGWLILGDWRIALPGAALGALIEFFSFHVDDNLTVPILSAVVLQLLTAIV
jgi:glycerol-3-phosphate acyltransferase PlsY